MLKAIVKLIKALNTNSHPGEIAHAVCCGMILGFMPKTNALWYILTVFFLFLRINKGGFLLSTFVFSLISPAVDPLFDSFGYWFLTLPSAGNVVGYLIEIPFVGFTKINNTIVTGSLLTSLIAYIPIYIFARLMVKLFRTTLIPALRKTKLIKIISKIPFIHKISEIAEAE